MIRRALRWLLVTFYAFAGIMHLSKPEPFLSIMPGYVPVPEAMVFWTGVAELLGAAALVQPWSKQIRKAGAIGLALHLDRTPYAGYSFASSAETRCTEKRPR